MKTTNLQNFYLYYFFSVILISLLGFFTPFLLGDKLFIASYITIVLCSYLTILILRILVPFYISKIKKIKLSKIFFIYIIYSSKYLKLNNITANNKDLKVNLYAFITLTTVVLIIGSIMFFFGATATNPDFTSLFVLSCVFGIFLINNIGFVILLWYESKKKWVK